VDDTSPASRARYYELLKRQSPVDRLQTAVSLTRAVRQLALADILRADPDASPRAVQAKLADRLYGEAIARRLFPSLADE
jgi:hypothetical protein